MEKMSKEQITKIAEQIIQESDIIANHGTSIKQGLSILESGFNYHRTSMVFLNNKKITALCGYGWKENAPGDAANVVISVPKEFYKDLLGYNDEQYFEWINRINKDGMEQHAIDSLSTMEFAGPLGAFKASLPKEFIKGMFIYTDNKCYLDFYDNPEDSLNYLTYVDNPNYYLNLSEEEKRNFVDLMRDKIFGEEVKPQIK